MAPSDPSSISADWVLRTRIELKSSEANIEKSNERLRLPPFAAWASRPLMRVRVKSDPRPRTEMVVPWPLTRSMVTPGRRWMASARFWSGKSAMSSARMASTAPASLRLMLRACCRLERKPVTTISSTWVSSCAVGAAGEAVWAAAICGVKATASMAMADALDASVTLTWLDRLMCLLPARRSWHRCH